MKSKIDIKKNAFEYIISLLVLWRKEVPIDLKKDRGLYNSCFCEEITKRLVIIDNVFKPEYEINQKSNFTMLFPFLILMASSDRGKLLSVFDNFCVTDFGIFECDLDKAYEKNEKIENFGKFDFPEVPYELIKESVSYLRKKNESIINWPIGLASFYSARHIVFDVFHKLGESYQTIPVEYLLKEKSYFSCALENMRFS
jgi:hypothetical protein